MMTGIGCMLLYAVRQDLYVDHVRSDIILVVCHK